MEAYSEVESFSINFSSSDSNSNLEGYAATRAGNRYFVIKGSGFRFGSGSQ